MTTYIEWCRAEALLIDADGCSGLTGFYQECCWEHDLAFYYAKDPRSAFRHWVFGATVSCWHLADDITFEEANRRFKRCHVSRTKWGKLSWLNPMVWIRWRGVVRLSRRAWDEHRAREVMFI